MCTCSRSAGKAGEGTESHLGSEGWNPQSQVQRTSGNIEGKLVQLSDKIAYINHDIDDAV